MDHVAVFLEHVYLFDGLDGLDVEFLQGALEFFVVGAGGLVDFLYFSPWGAFASVHDMRSAKESCHRLPISTYVSLDVG